MGVLQAQAAVLIDVAGIVGDFDDEAAIRRAQEKNAEYLQAKMRDLADRFVGSRGIYERSRNRSDSPGSMRDYYFADVQSNGDIIGYNNTARADYFELGTPPHEIWASGAFSRGRAATPRGARGQFTRGSSNLTFRFPGGFLFVGPMVDHPGQQPIPIMAMALEESESVMAENLLDEIEREWGQN